MQTPKPASFLRRLLSMAYDSLLVCALLIAAATPVVILSGGADSAFIQGYGYLLYLYMICLLFFCWFWVYGGQTLGMRSWRLHLIEENGGKVKWNQAMIRFIVATGSLLIFGLGFFWILFNRENLAWHDIASKTRLLYQPKVK